MFQTIFWVSFVLFADIKFLQEQEKSVPETFLQHFFWLTQKQCNIFLRFIATPVNNMKLMANQRCSALNYDHATSCCICADVLVFNTTEGGELVATSEAS